MRKKLQNFYFNTSAKIMCGMLTLGSFLYTQFPVIAHAADDLSWLKNGGDGTFSDVNTAIKGAGGSLYQVFMTLGTIGMVISAMIAGIGIMMNKNAAKKSEHKSHLADIALGALVIFGVFFFIGLIQSIATKLGG